MMKQLKSNPKRLSSISGRFKDGTLSDTRDNENIFSEEGFAARFTQQNDFVWIMEAIKR